jgi:hypothetical protein
MRKLLTFAGLMLIASVVGCQHTDSGCSSCGCGGNGALGHGDRHGPCTVGVCDCEIPALTPYATGLGVSPVPQHGVAATTAPGATPREMPNAAPEAPVN